MYIYRKEPYDSVLWSLVVTGVLQEITCFRDLEGSGPQISVSGKSRAGGACNEGNLGDGLVLARDH